MKIIFGIILSIILMGSMHYTARANESGSFTLIPVGFTQPQETVINNGAILVRDLLSSNLTYPTIVLSPESMAHNIVAMTHCTITTQGIQSTRSVTIGFNPQYTFTVPQVIHELIHAMQCVNPDWTQTEVAYAAAHPFPNDPLGSWFLPFCTVNGCEYIPHVIEALYDGSGPYYQYILRYPDVIRFALQHLSQP